MLKKQHKQISSNYTLLGVDIGDFSVKIIELSIQDSKYTIIGASQENWPEHTFKHGRMINKHAAQAALKKVLKNHSSKRQQAVISLPDALVTQHTLTLAQSLTPVEQYEWVRLEAEKLCPVEINTVLWRRFIACKNYFDYQILEISKEHANCIDIHMVVASSQDVVARLWLLQKVGLRPLAMDITSHALKRAMQISINDDVLANYLGSRYMVALGLALWKK